MRWATASRSKYGNRRTTLDGRSFASAREAARYQELCLLEQVGELTKLELQCPFKLVVNGLLICKYIADFVYIDKTGKQIVEDVKGYCTREYNLKKKLMLACHGIAIVEVQ